MSLLNRFSIKSRLYIGFAIIVFFTFVVSFLMLFNLSRVSKLGDSLVFNQMPLLNAVLEVEVKASLAHLRFLEVLEGDNKEIEEVNELMDEAIWYCQAMSNGGQNKQIKLSPVEDPQIKKELKKLESSLLEFKKEIDARYQMHIEGDEEAEEGSDIDEKFDETFESIITQADRIKVLINNELLQSTKRFRITEKTSKKIIFIIDAVFIFILLVLIVSLVKSITLPLDIVKDSLGRIANKDIDFQLEEGGNSEVSLLYRYVNRINHNFKQVILNIKETMNSVFDGAKFLRTVAFQISERANSQATTTEEIASSMEEMVATINMNTERAKITGQKSEESAQKLKENGEVFMETVRLVEEISRNISVITEIADKIDLLSINAAIEAARAGESGKGFAVVAQEIRKLADRTKQASDKIVDLSERGQNIAKVAGEKLEEIIPEIIESSKLVENIVIASMEQQASAENINRSIQDLTDISSQNSLMAEDMLTSVEQLTAQAQQLKELISVFKINTSAENEDSAAQESEDSLAGS